jgi:hypothetical protein
MGNELLVDNLVFPGELVLKYCGYWRTWNRVLYMNPQRGNIMVEVGLTAHNPTSEYDWRRVAELRIRKHRTGMEFQGPRRDRLYRFVVRKSPVFQELQRTMLARLEMDTVLRLLREDFLSRIDWPSYELSCNGGCPFALCSIEGVQA